MKTRIAIALTFLLALGIGGCAELDETGTGIAFHPGDWATVGSANNHAAALDAQGLPNSVQACTGCHASDYGKAEGDNCFFCHAQGAVAGHPETGFLLPGGAAFHGQAVIDLQGTDECAKCHAWEFDGELDFEPGGWSHRDCIGCHAGGRSGHPGLTEWFNPSSDDFHGVAAAGAAIAECAQCHGADYLGGWTGVSCNTCHPSGGDIHPDGWVGASTTEDTHGYLIELEGNGFDKKEDCQPCHGQDLEGGWSGEDCRPCHNDFYPPPRF